MHARCSQCSCCTSTSPICPCTCRSLCTWIPTCRCRRRRTARGVTTYIVHASHAHASIFNTHRHHAPVCPARQGDQAGTRPHCQSALGVSMYVRTHCTHTHRTCPCTSAQCGTRRRSPRGTGRTRNGSPVELSVCERVRVNRHSGNVIDATTVTYVCGTRRTHARAVRGEIAPTVTDSHRNTTAPPRVQVTAGAALHRC
jgi:hypothetical protein